MPEKIDADRQKKIFSTNLNYYMKRAGKNTADLAAELSFPFSTVSDWVHGKKYPRMDKVQTIADYFGIMKSHLTEENVLPLPRSDGVHNSDDEQKEMLPAYGRELSAKDIRLVKWFRSLPPEKQKAILISQDAPEDLVD